MHNGVLQEFNYFTGTYTPVIIPGFANSNIISFYSNSVPSTNGPYTDDNCLVGQSVEENIYAINLAALTQRKINTVNLLDNAHSWQASISTEYIIKGNTVYLAGSNFGNSITIGSQQIPFLNIGTFSNYLTKLNLISDFTAKSSATEVFKKEILENQKINIIIYPNPSSSSIRVSILENGVSNQPSDYRLNIYDNMNNTVRVFNDYKTENEADISNLRTGVYYLEIVNNKGQKAGKVFTKL